MKPTLNKEMIKKRIIQKQIKEQKDSQDSKKFVALYVFWLLLVIFFVTIGAIYLVYLQDLPSIKKLWEDVLPESTVIYDKNWWELYEMYQRENI